MAVLVGAVLCLDLLWSLVGGSTGTLAYGLVDEPAHLATCAIALLALAALTGARLPAPFVAAALLASVAIDVDHVPGYLGSHLLAGSLPRPYSHSLLLVGALTGLGCAWRRDEVRQISFGLAFGVAAHLLRDLATGPGVPLSWPFSSGVVAVSYSAFASILLLALVPALLRSERPPRGVRVGTAGRLALVAAIALALLPAGAARGQPIGVGAYLPGASEDPSLIDAYVSEVGAPPVIVSAYRDWTRPLIDRAALESAWDHGAVPMLTWEPWNQHDEGDYYPLSAIAAGQYDGFVEESARAAAAWGHPILLRFAHEMNGVWYPWGRGRNGNTPALYKAAWRHVVSIFRANGAINVKWVWTPYVLNGHRFPFRRYFPGTGWVDWAGLDGLNGGSIFGWRPFSQIFETSYRQLVRITPRPLILAEVASTEEGGHKAAWVSRALRRSIPRMPHIRAVVWWADTQDRRGDFGVDSSAAALGALQAAIEAPQYRVDREQLLSTPANLPRPDRRNPGKAHRHRNLGAGSGRRPLAARRPISLGAYVSSAGHPGRISWYKRLVGRRPVIVGSYKQWRLSPFVGSELEPVWKSGAVPMVTWEPWTYRGKGFPLRRIAAGAYDGYVRKAARAAAAWGHPILLRFAHEMNGGWYPWGRGRNGNTPALYKAAWRHVVSIFRANGAINVKWVWTPNVNNVGRYPFARYYPGDRWVDWVGLDGFNWGTREKWQSFGEVFDRSYRVLTRISRRPVIIAETGSTEHGGSKPRWVSRALNRELPRLARVRALVWFSQPFNGVDVRVNSSRAALRALRRSIRTPTYRPDRATLLSLLEPRSRLHF